MIFSSTADVQTELGSEVVSKDDAAFYYSDNVIYRFDM